MAATTSSVATQAHCEDVLEYLPASKTTEYGKGQMIYGMDTFPRSIYLVIKGAVAISHRRTQHLRCAGSAGRLAGGSNRFGPRQHPHLRAGGFGASLERPFARNDQVEFVGVAQSCHQFQQAELSAAQPGNRAQHGYPRQRHIPPQSCAASSAARKVTTPRTTTACRSPLSRPSSSRAP